MGDEERERTADANQTGSEGAEPAASSPALPPEADAHVLPDEVEYPGPTTALPPRVERWRRRSATGAMLTGFAMGLREVLETEHREPAIVLETSGVPPRDLAVEADLDNVPPRQSVVKVRRWLLEDPSAGPAGESAASAGPSSAGPAGESAASAGPAGESAAGAGPDVAGGTPAGVRPTEIRKRRRRSRSSRIFGSKG